MQKPLIVLLYILLFNPYFSQSQDSTGVFSTREYTISYFGNNLLKPGFKFKTAIVLAEKTIIKTKTKKSGKTIDNTKIRQLLLGGNIGFFWHPKSHLGAFNYYEFTYRKIKIKKGKWSKIGIGPGIYRSFYPETYEVDDNRGVDKVLLGGRTYFAPVLTFGSGKFLKNCFFKSRTFTTDLLFLFNYNSGIVPLLNFEIGFSF
jgi:hypothetical protein